MANVAQLKELAERAGISLTGADRKADIIERLNAEGSYGLDEDGEPEEGMIEDLIDAAGVGVDNGTESETGAEDTVYPVADESSNETAESAESAESAEPTPSAPSTITDDYFNANIGHRAYLAGFPMGEAFTKIYRERFGDSFDFRMPTRRELPRHVRQLKYAEALDEIRAFTFPHEVIIKTVEQVPFDLPEDAVIAPAKLQDLLVAVREASANGDDPPDWHDYV